MGKNMLRYSHHQYSITPILHFFKTPIAQSDAEQEYGEHHLSAYDQTIL